MFSLAFRTKAVSAEMSFEIIGPSCGATCNPNIGLKFSVNFNRTCLYCQNVD